MQSEKTLYLIKKYNVPAPRYTSYPTVPLWEDSVWDEQKWLNSIHKLLLGTAGPKLSLYVHLPYCESLCTYCGCNTRISKNHRVEMPYIVGILNEWQLYKQRLDTPVLLSELHLGGGTPTFFSPEHLQLLVAGLLEGMDIQEHASLSFEAHPANTTLEHLKVLHQLGFTRLSLGIQDFDPLVQQIINRQQSQEDVWRVLGQARETGYTSINFDLIYGLPLQTRQSVTDTVSEVVRMRPDRISFYSYAHVPWLKPGQRHYTENDLPSAGEKLELYRLGRQLLLQAGYVDIGMDHFAMPHDALFQSAQNGSLHRNFMGYTEQYTPLLIGLGVSAISDAWYGFSQNVKQVEAYLALVNDGKLPLLKGHTLSDEDLLLRRIILDIMCRGAASWDPGLPVLRETEGRLSPLAEDGLIWLEPGKLQVTASGKAFLRNICMAFDERMARQHLEKQTFSKAV